VCDVVGVFDEHGDDHGDQQRRVHGVEVGVGVVGGGGAAGAVDLHVDGDQHR
jgi:hypothetical protein